MLDLVEVHRQIQGRAVRRRHYDCGAPVSFGRRLRRAAGPKKSAAARRGVGGQRMFFKDSQKFRSILKIL